MSISGGGGGGGGRKTIKKQFKKIVFIVIIHFSLILVDFVLISINASVCSGIRYEGQLFGRPKKVNDHCKLLNCNKIVLSEDG